MKPIHFAALLLLGSIWGASFLFISVAVEDFGPLTLMFLRVFGAGMVLVLMAILTRKNQPARQLPDVRGKWRAFLVIGLFNSALPFSLIAFSELRLTSSMAAILNSTTPLFTALLAALWGSEAITGRKIGGVVMGMIGVAVLMGGSPLEVNAELILALFASLFAAFCYGVGTVYASKQIAGLPAIYAAIVQLLSASILLAIPAVLTLPTEMPSSKAILALLALILLSTSFAYLLYFFLLRNVGPTRTASVTFLVPVFGSIWGILFLKDPFNVGMLVGMAIILMSVGLVMGARRSQPAMAPPVVPQVEGKSA